MSEFQEKLYYAILSESLRAGVVVPFDCYIRLEKLNRAIVWVRSGEIFPKDKLNKIKAHSIKHVYIHVDDKRLYFEYLDQFLESDDGKSIKNELLANKNIALDGLP